MKQLHLIIVSLFIFSQFTHAQEKPKSYLGFGMGLDYGGFGARFEFMPIKQLGIIGGIGYNLVNAGYNGGVSWKLSTTKRGTPTLMVMYGYNAVIKLKNVANGVTQGYSYNGVTAGAGFELYNKALRNKLSCQILFPFRTSKFRKDYDRFKSMGYSFDTRKPDVLFSIGYNFGPKKRTVTTVH